MGGLGNGTEYPSTPDGHYLLFGQETDEEPTPPEEWKK